MSRLYPFGMKTDKILVPMEFGKSLNRLIMSGASLRDGLQDGDESYHATKFQSAESLAHLSMI